MDKVRHRESSAAEEGSEGALGPLGFNPEEALATVSNVAREHPHAALAGAFAAGFLLGGGLTPKLLGAVALFAARRYFRGAVEETLESVQQNLGAQFSHKVG